MLEDMEGAEAEGRQTSVRQEADPLDAHLSGSLHQGKTSASSLPFLGFFLVAPPPIGSVSPASSPGSRDANDRLFH